MRSTRAGSSVATALGAALFLLACGGGGDGGTTSPGLTASFSGSGTAASPDAVRFRGSSVSGTTITVDVELGGPTTSSDLYSFAFDVVLADPSAFAFVSGSARAGGALVAGPGQTVEAQAAQVGNRVVVGVSKIGGGSGNGVPTPTIVVSLTFRALRSGACAIAFDGAVGPSNPGGDPVALDSQGQIIPTIVFDGSSARLLAS